MEQIQRPTQAVILAGGRGTRLAPITDDIPKPMVQFHGKPFLEYLVDMVREQGFSEILMLLGYLPDKIMDYFGDGRAWGVSIRYSVSPVENETGRRLKLAKESLDSRFLLMYCDNYWPLSFDSMWQQFARDGAAADILEFGDDLNLGNVGRGGNRSAINATQECDFLLAVGTRFTPKIVINDAVFAKNATIAAIDIDAGELNDGLINIDHKINCDLVQFVPALLNFFEEVRCPAITSDWKDYVGDLRSTSYVVDETRENDDDENPYVSPYVFMSSLFEELTENAVVIPDAGLHLNWTYQGNRIRKGQRIIASLGASPMGYALPAAIGAYYANKDAEIICIIGDGGFQMNIQELQAIKFNEIPAKLFIMNNESLGNTRFPAASMFGRSTGNDAAGGYAPPDFVAVAEAYGIESCVLDKDSDLIPTLRRILDSPKPMLIDVKIDPEQFMLDTPLS